MKGLLHLTKELIFPPRCASCGKLREPRARRAKVPLCEGCAAAWARELNAACPRCFLSYHACRCSLPHMKKSGILQHVKLARYVDENDNTVAGRLILRLKEQLTKECVSFLAAELAPGVRAAMETAVQKRRERGEADLSRTVVTFLPRPKLRKRRAGFDQSAELARALARELGLVFCPLLRRVGYGVPQKELSRKERMESIKGSFAPLSDASGLRVLLVDDLVTTGAGIAEGASVLGAGETIAVSIAIAEKK